MRSDNDGDEVTNSVMGLDLSMLRDDGTEVHSNGVELRDAGVETSLVVNR